MSQSIVILTEDRYENPKEKNWYTKNILKEDSLLLNALCSLGFRVTRSSWSSKTFNWDNVDYAIFRTTWDYFERLDEFLVTFFPAIIFLITSIASIESSADFNLYDKKALYVKGVHLLKILSSTIPYSLISN